MEKRVLLIDAMGLLFRAFYSMPKMSAADGTPVNAIHGLVRILLKVFRETPACACGIVYDAGAVTFRNAQYEGYKATRTAPPDELVPQFDLAREAAQATAAPVYCVPGFEADDVIATLADHACARGLRVAILTGDRDLLQLLDGNIDVLMMKGAGEYRPYDPASFEAEFGFPVQRYVDYKALMGDPSDNIPGVPGIGQKTAGQLVATHGKLETLYANIDMVKPDRIRGLLKEHRDAVFAFRDLVTLRHDVEVEYDFDGRTMPDFGRAEFQALLERCGFGRVRDDAAKLGDLQPAEKVVEGG